MNKEEEDIQQESLAYMKTKLFMARRIFEQQAEIETLKEQLLQQNIKYMQLFESIKLTGGQTNGANNRDPLNLSGDLANSLDLEGEGKEKDNNVMMSNTEFNLLESVCNDKLYEKVILQLKGENLELTKELEALRANNMISQLSISKLTADRMLLYNELCELTFNLKKMNLEVLNKIYKETAKNKSVTSGLGIKINILSACGQIAMITGNSNNEIKLDNCIHVINKFEDELNNI
jgi:hypothetical protein